MDLSLQEADLARLLADVVEGHGGSMSLTSAPGAGTTATFVLPAS